MTEAEISQTDRWGNPKYLAAGIWVALTVLGYLRAWKNVESNKEYWKATGPIRSGFFQASITVIQIFFVVPCMMVYYREALTLQIAKWTLALWFVQLVFVNIGLHRLFSHNAYKPIPAMRAFIAFMTNFSMQGGPLQWALQHRHHHARCEEEDDVHSPIWLVNQVGGGLFGKIVGFFWAQGLWLVSKKTVVVNRGEIIPDLLECNDVVCAQAMSPWMTNSLMVLAWYYGGLANMTWLYLAPKFMSNNSEQFSNSICHLWGDRAFVCGQAPKCESRNVWWLTFAMIGGNWHNNHHTYPSACWHGWEWWQLDIAGIVIWTFYQLGLVTSMRARPTADPELFEEKSEAQETSASEQNSGDEKVKTN